MAKKQKLELTWVGKENRLRLEPRILLEDPEKSYHAAHRIGESDIFDNRLIFGDNLLALKALEQEFSGRVKCVFIDPPYNTGSAMKNEHYEDGLEHSIWLSLMRDRVELLRTLLSDDGLIFVQIDDNEMPYLTVLMDEIFGRNNRINIIAVKMSEASGVKMSHVDKKLPKLKEYVLVYRKMHTPKLEIENVPIGEWNDEYKTILLGLTREQVNSLKEIISGDICNSEDVKKCNLILSKAYTESLSSYFRTNKVETKLQAQFKLDNAWRIIQAVGSSSVLAMAKAQPHRSHEIAAGLSARGLIYLYKTDFDTNAKQPRIQVIFADENLMRNPGDFWTDIRTTGGVAQEGGVLFPNGKKPEALVKRIIEMCTKSGELVLDSFAGSGTTGAVAHKLGRRWIMVELGEHCHTHIIPRLRKVIDGEDKGGVTDAVGWQGGGGFRYFKLAPSLLEIDKWGREVISKAYNAEMLAEALCKIEGFTYAPSDAVYWQHGHSTERDFIYVTTQTLGVEQLQQLSEEVGSERSLLVLCSAFRGNSDRWPNLTVKKIPNHIQSRCEWGHDDYSLNVENLPKAPPRPEPEAKSAAKASAGQPDLLGAKDEGSR
jgi:adenine-specific DNA-methyltransferase